MDFKTGESYKIVLKDNYVYKGKLLSKKDKLIDFYDNKIGDIRINIDAIFVIIPLKDGDLRDFTK